MTFERSLKDSDKKLTSRNRPGDVRSSDWKLLRLALFVLSVVPAGGQLSSGWPRPPKFRVITLAERAGGDHQKFVDAAKVYLNKLAEENDFTIDYMTGTERI